MRCQGSGPQSEGVIVTLLALHLSTPALHLGTLAPPLRYRSASGQPQSLPTGRPLIISFWASWCSPCREELPRLLRAAGKIQVLALNYGESLATAQGFLRREGLGKLTVGYVGASDPNLWPIPGVPTSLLLDAKGMVRRVQYGPLGEATLNSWLALKLK
jgi:cytochrome c biogenesis protein CcmG, thiol:disulfide interchange protein DsbE